MASNANVGTAVIALRFDSSIVRKDLSIIEGNMESAGKESGNRFGDAWTIALGNLLQKGVSKTISIVSSNIDNAISRVDTLNNFPKVMENLGVSSDDAANAISKMSDNLQGLPTNLDQGASAVQRFTSKNGDVSKSTDIFLALNNAILAGGQSTDIQATALEQLSQAYAKGKPDMVEWHSAMVAMPGQLKQVAMAMGYGEDGAEALGEALRNGDVTMDEFMDTISRLNTEGVGDFKSFEQQAKDSTGGIQTAISVMNSRITQGIAAVINEIGSENIAGVAEGIGNAIKNIGITVANVINFVITNWGIIGPILATVATVAGVVIAINAALNAYRAVQTAVNAVQLAFNLIMHANPIFLLATVIAGVVAALTLFFTQTEIGKGIIQGFGDVVNTVFSFIGGIITSIAGIFQGAWDGIMQGAQNVWNFITGIFSALGSFFGSVFGGAWERVKAIFSTGGQIFMGIVDGITNAFRTIVNAIITGINHVVAIPFNAINGFLGFLKGIDILGIKPFDWVGTIDVPQIPLLAQGGVTRGATQAVIGEAGQEVVLPLDNNTDNWAGLLASTIVDEMDFREDTAGRGVVIQKQEFIINNEMDAYDIGRVMMQSIRRAA